MTNSQAMVRENVEWQCVDYGADRFLVASYSATDNWRSRPSIAPCDWSSSTSTRKPQAEKGDRK